MTELSIQKDTEKKPWGWGRWKPIVERLLHSSKSYRLIPRLTKAEQLSLRSAMAWRGWRLCIRNTPDSTCVWRGERGDYFQKVKDKRKAEARAKRNGHSER